MSLNQEVDVLRKIPLFSQFEESRLKLIAFTSERLNFQPGQYVFHQGDEGDAAFIFLEGAGDVLLETEKGEILLASIHKNEIIGEISILCDVPRTASIVITKPTILLRISKDMFFKLIQEFPMMAIEIMKELAKRLEKANDQYKTLLSKQA